MKTKLLIFLLLINAGWASNLQVELPTITKAAERNGIQRDSDDFRLLCAIRLAENGRPGREFGIMNPKANTLDKQAGWCAATIMNQHKRFGSAKVTPEFIHSLAKRYCPIGCDTDNGTNQYWERNVTYFYGRLKWKR